MELSPFQCYLAMHIKTDLKVHPCPWDYSPRACCHNVVACTAEPCSPLDTVAEERPDHHLNMTDIDSKLKRGCCHQAFKAAGFEPFLNLQPFSL